MSVGELIFIGVAHTMVSHLFVWGLIPLEFVHSTESIYNIYDYGFAFVNPSLEEE